MQIVRMKQRLRVRPRTAAMKNIQVFDHVTKCTGVEVITDMVFKSPADDFDDDDDEGESSS